MWLLIALLAFNAIADKSFILSFRFDIAGLPINVLDVLMVLCVIAACFMIRRQEQPWADRVHPLFWISLLLFAASLAIGTVEGGLADIPARWVITPMRNLATLPLIIFCAYRLVDSPAKSMLLLKALIWTSAASAICAMLFVSRTAEQVAEGSTFDQFRGVSIGGDLGMFAACVMVYGLVSRVRLYGRWLTLALLLVGSMGTFALPHRSAWLTAAITLVYATFFLYRRETVHKLVTGVLIVLTLSAVGFCGVLLVSKTTGRDYSAYVGHRLLSFLPGDREHFAGPEKPWDTRLPGLIREFELWTERPVSGQGFGIQDVEMLTHPAEGYRHNVWTSTLAETGLIGFSGICCVVFGLLVVGFRLANDRVDVGSVLLGAAASSLGVWAFLLSSFTESLNTQRCAISVGAVFGAMLKTRAMQLASRRRGEEEPTRDASYPSEEQQAFSPQITDYAYSEW